eukprot:symbB.v1.2.034118.t1/scaffold4161.1/size43725/2
MTFDLRVQTPAQNVIDARWFVLAKQVIRDEITGQIDEPVNGWAVASGFTVSPCPVTLMYGSIASATGWLALSFYVPRSVQGKFALITSPQDFQVKCPQAEETGLVLECQDFRPRAETPTLLQSLQRTVNVTLGEGTEEGDNMLYMFLLNVLTPSQEPTYDPWQVRVLDSGFDVVDAALNVPQPGFVPDLEMGNPSLSWLEPPQMGEVSNVQVEVSFLRRVKDVKAVLVSLPENYRHDIQHKNQQLGYKLRSDSPVDQDVSPDGNCEESVFSRRFWRYKHRAETIGQPYSAAPMHSRSMQLHQLKQAAAVCRV